jgi:hypothetical protein
MKEEIYLQCYEIRSEINSLKSEKDEINDFIKAIPPRTFGIRTSKLGPYIDLIDTRLERFINFLQMEISIIDEKINELKIAFEQIKEN